MIHPLDFGYAWEYFPAKTDLESQIFAESHIDEMKIGLNASPGRLSSETVPVVFAETVIAMVLFTGGVYESVATVVSPWQRPVRVTMRLLPLSLCVSVMV